MWSRKYLKMTGDAGNILCSVIDISPWSPGVGLSNPSGLYLSPENAVTAAINKMRAARPEQDVTAVLFSTPDLTGFISTLNAAADVFPLAQLMQVCRRANTALTLEQTKMQIPSGPGSFPPVALLSVATLRHASAAQALIDAASSETNNTEEALKAFQAQRAEMLSAARKQLDDIAGQSLPVMAVSVSGDVAGAIREMSEQVPYPDHVFTLCLVFIGDDLSALRGMLHDELTT
ncbi:TPA: hypothetical protein QIF36_004173 [Enterobacter kobei]|nr:hypothetical protein [Enterobacter kobei]